jgi:osmoprotectant transport system permease protein
VSELFQYIADNWTAIQFAAQSHLLVVAYAVGLSTLIAVVLAIALHTNRLSPTSWTTQLRAGSLETALLVSSALLTVPSLALFGILQPILGLGIAPALVGLTMYGIYPVLRNTVAGLNSVDPAVLDAARGIGMSPLRRLARIQFPMAWPVILSGIRVSVLISISITVVAAVVSDLGFGELLLAGLARLGSTGAFEAVVVGTLGPIVVAAIFEIVYALLKRFTTPRGLRV